MLKKLLSSVREYKKDSILAPVFVALEVVMEVIIPMLMSLLIDNGIDANNMTYVYTMGGILIVCSLVSLLFGALSGKCSAVAASGFAKNLRHDMFHNVQNFSFSNIDKFKTSSIITRLTTDVTNVQMAYMMVIRIAVRCPLMLVFALTMSMIVNYRIAWIFFIIAPILGVALFFIMKNVHPIFTRMFKNYDKLNNVVQENVRGIRVVKSFVREDHESEKFTGVSKLIRDDSVRAERILMLTNPLIQFCVFSLNILIAWFSARLIVAGDMTTGELSSMILYAA
ncbi:MAG TPA: ABC transporter permease, partial [Bacillota bacterium]|nr:ABC transporter permease [Bacillota bacterium]